MRGYIHTVFKREGDVVMKNYTIFSLEDTVHLEEICADIYVQKESGIAECPLFMMPLVPAGNPPLDKASEFCKVFCLYRDRLAEMGIPCGILVQSTLGHAHMNMTNLTNFRQYVNLSDGQKNIYCPSDPGFQDYFEKAMFTLASCHPDVIMVDDDFRLLAYRSGKACACSWHLQRFNELAGTAYTREELYSILCLNTEEALAFRNIFVETQKESLLAAAKAMRKGIDRADSTIQGAYCCCGNNAEFAAEIADVLAGKNNPKIVRINNGNYCNTGLREVCASVSYRGACQIEKIKDQVDYILAETDTCPNNRYSTSAYSMHTNTVASILEGVNGAKHWITRLHAYEPGSGTYYRKVLSKYRGFYDTLIDLVSEMEWMGCCIPVSTKPIFNFTEEYGDAWFHYVLERLGIPMYFSGKPGDIVFLDTFSEDYFSEDEILQMLSKTIFMTVGAAERLSSMGYSSYIGVKIEESVNPLLQLTEKLLQENCQCQAQKNSKRLVPLSEDVRVDSYLCDTMGNQLYPATTVYKNALGGCSIVFCGSPRTKFHLAEAFSFLNASRKQQLLRLIRENASLSVYYPEDAEVYMRLAKMKNGGLCCVIINTCPDPIEQLPLCVDFDLNNVQVLCSDGTIVSCDYLKQDGQYHLNLTVYPMQPQVILLNAGI